MSNIFHGGNTYIFYNTDAGNNIPTSIGYKNIDQLGAFPLVRVQSSTTQFETYSDEWVQILASQMSIDSVSIAVHYVPDNTSHQFLDLMFTNGTKFQIKVSLYESQTSLNQHYVILSGYVSAFVDSSDQNEIFDRTYTFTAEDVISRGTAVDPAPLHIGDFGVGADGESIPQYESDTPSGNSFIKVPATRADNPLGIDLGGFAYVDNGGDQGAQFVMSETGPINIYTKNTDTPWTLLPTKLQNDQTYVPLTRTVNSHSLNANIVLTKADVGLSDVLNVPSYSKTETDSKFVTKITTVNGYPLSTDVVLTKADVGLSNVLNVPSYSKTESDAITNLKADKSITINGNTLTDNIVISTSSIGALAVANNLSDVANAPTARANISAAKNGVNGDITGLTALSGSLRLGADAGGDYDAVTLRQLLAAGGTSGPTITGVMNNYIGGVSWFNGSRAKLPAGHLAGDGQLLSRATYPEIWSAISSGMYVSVADADWQANTGIRGNYTTGDGSTTFRMPDLNGVWTHPTNTALNSIPGLYLRGSGANASGVTHLSGAPNITGSVGSSGTAAFQLNQQIGAFKTGTINYNYNIQGIAGTASPTLNFDASLSNAVYGRSAGEIRTNAAIGIWVIRVNGMFSASSTNFNVYNGDTAAPAAGTVVYGGDVRSVYQIAGSDYAVARLRSTATIGTSRGVVISLQDSSSGTVVNTDWRMPATAGTLALSTDARFDTVNGKTGGTISSALSVTGVLNCSSNLNVGTTSATGSLLVTGVINCNSNLNVGMNSATSSQVMAASTNTSELNRAGGLFNSIIYTGTSNRAQANFYMATTGSVRVAKIDVYADGGGGKSFQFYQDSGNGTCSGTWNGGSDERHKSNIVLVPNALQAVLTWRGVTYDKKDGGSEVGLIAQDVEKDCPVAVTTNGDREFEDGTVVTDFKYLNTGGVAAAYHTEAIKELYAIIQDLQSRITELESNK